MNGEDFALQNKDVADVYRKLAMIWNMYDFFTLYADVDGWEWNGELDDPSSSLTNPLDQWIVSRLHQLIEEVESGLDKYDIPNALAPILPFIDDASNWYVRRSRRRFWKSGDSNDKQDAYRTLHYVLVQLAHIMAPITPFLADELYQKLTGKESVHLSDWPQTGYVNELVIRHMAELRSGIEQGLSMRAAERIKVRQPLKSVTLYISGLSPDEAMLEQYRHIISEELNVKEAIIKDASSLDTANKLYPVELDTNITPDLKREGLAREVIRHIQSERKKAQLLVSDRIVLGLSTSNEELRKAVTEYSENISAETLATQLAFDRAYDYKASTTIDDMPLSISFQKA
jgi:isoleucyl-tRNA synthetase